ncbi:tetratricopeptide repeat protein [Lacimicrobium alkaliphilum]|uniref:Tetratricopeptide repeat protein n=1 Tax=Lacimicrobium alkaliphilum TaxID=1526571 RepID=A0ABQ1R165_9ALTE|nr:tetratricopeptide repeat protein [Lacimicrobium alkaliphilum]GGD52579.1 hypothetical protein GCM10011357_05530 [Lacimicrobium alkaliphilum]
MKWIIRVLLVINLSTWSAYCLALSEQVSLDQLYEQVSQSRQQGLIDEADELAHRLMQAAAESGSSVQQGKAIFALARNHMERNQYPQAKNYLNQAIELFQGTGNEKWLADSYRQLGLTYRYQTQYPDALRYIYLAMQIYRQLDDTSSISSAYNSIGLVTEKMGQYEEAIQAHQKALELNYQLEDKPGVASAIYNLGDISKKKKRYSKRS